MPSSRVKAKPSSGAEEDRRGLRRDMWDLAERLAFAEAQTEAVREDRNRLRQRAAQQEEELAQIPALRRSLWRHAERLAEAQQREAALEAETAVPEKRSRRTRRPGNRSRRRLHRNGRGQAPGLDLSRAS